MNMNKINNPILIIDDDKDILSLLKGIFKKQGFKVICVENVEEGFERFKNESPFLIISDLRMKEKDALSLCKDIRATGSKTPFIILTGFADKEAAISGLEIGVTQILEKPFNSEVLLKLSEKYADEKLKENNKEHEEQNSVTTIFIEEAKEILENFDKMILSLETNPVNPVTINMLYVGVHTIKGSSGVVPLSENLTKLAHHFESSLTNLKNKKFELNSNIINLYLSVNDALLGQIESISRGTARKTDAEDIKLLCEQLTALEENNFEQANVQQVSIKDNVHESENILVTNEKLDSLMRLCGELVILKNTFYMIASSNDQTNQNIIQERRLWDFNRVLNRFSDNLQEQMMSIRKVSLNKSQSKMQRLFRQTCIELGKKANLKIDGFDLSVDKNIAKVLSISITHIIRNSIDHGFELESVRGQQNKTPIGTLHMQVRESGGAIYFDAEDDGCGINIENVRRKAVEKGLLTESAASSLSEIESIELIFLPGFSTVEEVTNISGRGIGMDAIRSVVLSVNGKIQIFSKLGKGTRLSIEIPIPKTVIVEQTIITRSGNTLLAIPLTGISHITSVNSIQISSIGHHQTMQYAQTTIRIVDLNALMKSEDIKLKKDYFTKESIIVLRGKRNFLGLFVDEIVGQLEAVVRPFNNIIGNIESLKGTTVLDEERIAYVLSPQEAVATIFESHDEQEEAA
jgi:two-component system, chemotaxis family, sensor kinase CheA